MSGFDFQAISQLIWLYGGKILIALVLLFIGFKLVNKLVKIIIKGLKKREYDPTIINFTKPLLRISLKVLILISLVSYLGITTTSFVAVIGGASFAIGLAFQGSLSNFAGGVLLLTLKPFKVGDYIEVGSHTGKVKTISVFYTYLTTFDNKEIVIPNSMVSNGSLVNYTANTTRRIDLTVGVDYSTKIDDMKETINEIVKSNELILDDPAPIIGLGEYGDSSINFHVKVWVKSENYWTVYYRFHEEIKRTFDAKGIEFPFPHMDVNIYKNVGAEINNG